MNTSKQAGQRAIRAFVAVVCLFFGAVALGEDCSEFPGGIIDGSTGIVAPSQIQIDRTCTIRNFPASNPLSTNFSFLTQPGQNDERWVVIFDNVVHTGQMACNAVAGHKIWFTNGSSTAVQDGCQNLLIPVEKIEKANPPGNVATVGVPFTYRLTMPVLHDPATGAVIDTAGSLNDLHGVTVWDDLAATGVDLTYVTHAAVWEDTGTSVAHTFVQSGSVLTFDGFPIVSAGRQILLDITVVLEDTPGNVVGTQFINTAKWDFGRLIDGVFYEPLPGEWGISPPLTIAAPALVVDKSGPITLNLGQVGRFTLDVANTGTIDAWDVTLVDRLPNGVDGGMCDAAPAIVSARVYAADGVTPVVGKGPLTPGVDLAVSFAAAPACELSIAATGAEAVIGPTERLIVVLEGEIDWDTRDGATLINVAGATAWFNGGSGNAERQAYNRPLTNGTPGIADHEDDHSVTTDLSGYVFLKTVANQTTGESPALTARPGETLRYTLRVRTTDSALNDFGVLDDLGALNGAAVFAPGSLAFVPGTLPAGSDTSATDPAGGTNGAGLLDVTGLNLAPDSELTLSFEVVLAPSIANGTVVSNQAALTNAPEVVLSDDPSINGQASPDVVGDEDPTAVSIQSAPLVRVDKISSYPEGDPAVLMAGELLHYTISVWNYGTEDAVAATLRDAIPASTSYVAGSTTLNGITVPDVSGAPPLVGGIAINAVSSATPGRLPADSLGANVNRAVIEFTVRTDPDLIDGAVISNQAYASADVGIVDQPSDDPRTPIANDPTRDVVGAAPLLFATKSAELELDAVSVGVVDPGDTLRYTITVYNNGTADASDAVLTDAVPANTAYVADSVSLNGAPVAQPDGGVFPLAQGLPISSSDVAEPGVGNAALTRGESATVSFLVRVDDGLPSGTVISNQATVSTAEVADLLTDGDGDPATGPEPTIVVVGPAQQLAISKRVAVVGGGAALAGETLEYTVVVSNPSSVPALDVRIVDDLNDPLPGQLTYVAGSVTLNGAASGVAVIGAVLSVDYGDLAPDGEITLRFLATIHDSLDIGTTVINKATAYWNAGTAQISASVALDVGGVVGVGTLTGSLWHDADFDDQRDEMESALVGWTIELHRDGRIAHLTNTGPDGTYRISGIPPNYQSADPLALVFKAPDAGIGTAMLGVAYSPDFPVALQTITDIVLTPGSNFANQDMPIDPNGVVYDSVSRTPVAGVTLTLLDRVTGMPVPVACFDDPGQQGQTTRSDGYYKFDLNFSDSGCASGAVYRIDVLEPLAGYSEGYSEVIAPTDILGVPFDVEACLVGADDAVPATDAHCEIQGSTAPPAAGVRAGTPGTLYKVSQISFSATQPPGTSQIFNNHIPIDPVLDGVVGVTKTTPMVNVSRGQLVPYTIVVTNSYPVELVDITIVDRLPGGFSYVDGSARLDGIPIEPTVVGRELRFEGAILEAEGTHTLQLVLGAGAGVTEGEYVNRAQVLSQSALFALSGEATATVRIVPDPTFDCTDVFGKVFDDDNRNGLQDSGEVGLAGVRLMTVNGLAAKTDASGNYHITCAAVPREGRGSNFVLKLDDRTLPSGFRSSTSTVQVQRVTRGKAARFNFAASIHRVVGLEVSDAVFVPDSVILRPQWKHRYRLLLEELQKSPSVLRITYLADIEPERLVRKRLKSVKRAVTERWRALDCCYALELEDRVFWRRGGPTDPPARLEPGHD